MAERRRSLSLGVVALLVSGLTLGLVLELPTPTTGGGTTISSTTVQSTTVVSSTTQITSQEVAITCSTHSFLNRDDGSGGGCAQPAFTDISGQANFQTQITNFPAGCATGSYVNTIGATSTCQGHIDDNHNALSLNTAAPTLVQNTFNTGTSGTTVVKAFGSNLGAKNTVMVWECEKSTTTALVAPTDTLGLTFVSVNTASATSDGICQAWKAMTHGGGADTVTGNYGATCTATLICQLFINEYSGTDIVLVTSTTGSSTSTTTSPVMTSNTFSLTPAVFCVYVKTTAGTDTAGANFALANGEAGSLTYLTEKSTSLTSTSTTCPATFGTASAFAGVGAIILKASTMFSETAGANTYFTFSAFVPVGSIVGVQTIVWVHDLDTGATLLSTCGIATASCITATDTIYGGAAPATNAGINLMGTIHVGSTPTTILIEFGDTTGATTNAFNIQAGSFIAWRESP